MIFVERTDIVLDQARWISMEISCSGIFLSEKRIPAMSLLLLHRFLGRKSNFFYFFKLIFDQFGLVSYTSNAFNFICSIWMDIHYTRFCWFSNFYIRARKENCHSHEDNSILHRMKNKKRGMDEVNGEWN